MQKVGLGDIIFSAYKWELHPLQSKCFYASQNRIWASSGYLFT